MRRGAAICKLVRMHNAITTERRLVAITGANRGIGRALVEVFLQADWDVVACVRSAPSLSVQQGRRDRVHFALGHLEHAGGAAALGAELVQRFPNLAGLVNNAATQALEPFTSPQSLGEEFQLNVQSPIALGTQLAPTLARNQGFVANISSGLAYIPQGRSPVYAATKAALSMYTKAARLQQPEVRFVEVILPLVDTDMTRGRGQNKMSADDAARQIVRGIERGDLTLCVGKAKLLPLLLRLAPSLLTRAMNPRGASP